MNDVGARVVEGREEREEREERQERRERREGSERGRGGGGGGGAAVRPRRRPAAFAVISWALGLVLLVFVAAPLVALLTGTSLHEFVTTIGQADVRQALFVSVEAALLATVLAAIGGVPLAYLLARRSFRGKRLVEGLIDLPIVFPHTAAGIALLLVFGRSGVFGRGFAHLGIAFTDTLAGVVVAMLFVSLPFLVDTAREAFALVDPGYERVARTLGATPGVAFVRVALPLARRGVLAGALLMWARGMSEFGAIVILAYNPKTMSVLTYERFESGGLDAAKPAALLIVLLALVVFIVVRSIAGRREEQS